MIEKLCINKEEVTFKCEGKCHLKTEPTKAKNQDESPITGASETNHNTSYTIAFKKLECKKQVVQDNPIALTPLFIEQEYTGSIFQPPKV